MRDIFQRLSDIDAGRVLDAATGRGEFIQIIKTKFKSYTQIIGIDSSQKSIDIAQKLFPENDIEIFKMDLEELHFEDSYFDTVTISNSLHHFEHIDKVFAELMRVLKPGGLFLVTEMYRDGNQSPAQQTNIAMHHWVAKMDTRAGVHHGQTFLKDEIIAMLGKLKLNNTDITDFYYPCDNPKEAKGCESLINTCQDILKRLEAKPEGIFDDNPENAGLIEEGYQIIDQIKESGCASASRLLITAYKH